MIAGTLALSVTETADFRRIVFEVFSAVGTVGLTTGLTGELSTPGRFVMAVLMFAGRVGPLVLVFVMTRAVTDPQYRLPEDRIGIG